MSVSINTIHDMCNTCTGTQDIEIKKLEKIETDFINIECEKVKLILVNKPGYNSPQELKKSYLLPYSDETAYRNIRIETDNVNDIEFCEVYVGGQLFEKIYKETFSIISKIRGVKDKNIIPFGIFSDKHTAFPVVIYHDTIIVVKNILNNAEHILTAEPCHITQKNKINIYRLYGLKDISKLCNVNLQLPDAICDNIKKYVGNDFHIINKQVFENRSWITTHADQHYLRLTNNNETYNEIRTYTVYWNHPTRYIVVNINYDLEILNMLINNTRFSLNRTFKMDNFHVFEFGDNKTLNFSRIDNVRLELPGNIISVFTIFKNITTTRAGMTNLRFCG